MSSTLPPTVLLVQKKEMRPGQEYVMQRGPTRKPRKVTLLDMDVPSGASHRVLVRVEDGVGAGKELEAPSQSIRPLPGAAPPKKGRGRKATPRQVSAPQGWVPTPGEVVAWTRTLGSRWTVLEVDAVKGITRIEGTVMAMRKEFDAPIVELSPYIHDLTVVPDEEIEKRLKGRLPEKPPGPSWPVKRKPPRVESIEGQEDIVERLIFSEQCLRFYRRRFAKGANAEQAEEQLRAELRSAARVRKRHTREYLRLRVPGRFDVVLYRRPVQGNLQSCFVMGLRIPAGSRRQKAA